MGLLCHRLKTFITSYPQLVWQYEKKK